LSDAVTNDELTSNDAFILGVWLVTPSLNTVQLNTTQPDASNIGDRMGDATNDVRKVTPKVMALCEYLVRFHGQPKSQHEIAQAVWPERVISDSSIYQAVAQLRKALSHDSDETQYVERVSGKGYRINAPLTFVDIKNFTDKPPIETKADLNKASAVVTRRRPITIIALVLLSVVLMAFVISFYQKSPLTTQVINTVAVLPTDNLSHPHNEAFDSFSQLILSELVTQSSYKFIYLRAKGGEVTAQAQLVTSILRDQDKLLASIQLLESSTGKVLWADNFTANHTNYLKLKNDVVAGLINHLMPNNTLENQPQNNKSPQDAHFEEYALAHYFWDQRKPNALEQAKIAFENILQQSPQHIGALVGLCHTYLYLSVYSDLPQALAYQRCKPHINKAVALAPNKGEVIATQALLQLDIDDRNDEQLDQLFKRAINAAPNYAMAHHWYGNYLRQLGQYQQGLKQHRTAYSLDPLSPIIIRGLSYAYLNVRQLNSARKYYQRALTIEPNYAHRAVEELDFLLLNSARASAFLDWLDNPSNIADKPVYRLTQALVWLGLGKVDTAQHLIEQAQTENVNQAFLLYCQGALASAKGDFPLAQQKMTARLNLTPSVTRYAMPHITALFYNNQTLEALSALQKYFPQININGQITHENSGLYVLLSRIYQRLNDISAQQKINQRLHQFIQQGGELTPTNRIYWAFINDQHQQVLQLINQQFNSGWLPDFNDNIFAQTALKNMYLGSGGSHDDWQLMLIKNRTL